MPLKARSTLFRVWWGFFYLIRDHHVVRNGINISEKQQYDEEAVIRKRRRGYSWIKNRNLTLLAEYCLRCSTRRFCCTKRAKLLRPPTRHHRPESETLKKLFKAYTTHSRPGVPVRAPPRRDAGRVLLRDEISSFGWLQSEPLMLTERWT